MPRYASTCQETSVMMLDEGFELGIRCRFVSNWFKMDSYIYTKEKLLSEIDRNRPDVVVMDLDLYAKIGGVKISKEIRERFAIPIIYQFTRFKICPTTEWNWTF